MFSDWTVGADYECQKLLGKGSYGAVCQAIHKPTGTKVAIKRMEGVFEDETDCKRILREVKLLRRMRHPYVVNLLDIIEPSDRDEFDILYIVLEYAESDLKKVIKSAIHLQIAHIKTVVYNLLCAVRYIHSADVLHRDLKPANVLINEDCTVKLCDFGLARSIAGVQSASWIISGKQKAKSEEEEKVGADDEDFALAGSSVQKIHHQDTGEAEEEAKSAEDKKKAIKNRLVRTKNKRKSMKRELTGHVVTRWYRAPELILLEKDYGPAIDVWSIGCIFAELLGMMKENAPTYLDRRPLFPGKSCFPLSPDKKPTEKRHGFPFSNQDQLSVIFSVLGTPSEDDLSFVTDQKAIEYLNSFSRKDRKNLREMYSGCGDDAIDFLDKCLQFNPYFRIQVDEALNHSLFEDIRKQENELSAENQICFDFEKESLDKDKLRELFLEEIDYFKSQRESG